MFNCINLVVITLVIFSAAGCQTDHVVGKPIPSEVPKAPVKSVPILLVEKSPAAPVLAPSTVRVADTLLERRWNVDAIDGKTLTKQEQNMGLFILLRRDKPSFRGDAGCNIIFGGYTIKGKTLTFGMVASTKRACRPGMELEDKFIKLLSKVAAYKQESKRLFLLDTRGEIIISLHSQ